MTEKVLVIHYTRRDRYGRILGTIYVDAMNVNRELVAAGHAYRYSSVVSRCRYRVTCRANHSLAFGRLGVQRATGGGPTPPAKHYLPDTVTFEKVWSGKMPNLLYVPHHFQEIRPPPSLSRLHDLWCGRPLDSGLCLRLKPVHHTHPSPVCSPRPEASSMIELFSVLFGGTFRVSATTR